MPEPGEGLQISKREPEVLCKGIPAIAASKSAPAGAQLQRLRANARSMWDKQEQQDTAHLQGCDLTGIRYVVGWLL